MLTIRNILPQDNAATAKVIQTVMPEFNCVGEGFSINDPEVADMASAYAVPGAAFFVLADASAGADAGAVEGSGASIVGCGGFAPLAGGDGSTCELRKMYLLREARGLGGGRMIMQACLDGARKAGYTHMYLETVTAMTDAAAVYLKYGFEYLDLPLGDTGHSGCDRFMLRAL